jgi:hypothetical protein
MHGVLRAGEDVGGGVDWYSFALSFKGVFLVGGMPGGFRAS